MSLYLKCCKIQHKGAKEMLAWLYDGHIYWGPIGGPKEDRDGTWVLIYTNMDLSLLDTFSSLCCYQSSHSHLDTSGTSKPARLKKGSLAASGADVFQAASAASDAREPPALMAVMVFYAASQELPSLIQLAETTLIKAAQMQSA